MDKGSGTEQAREGRGAAIPAAFLSLACVLGAHFLELPAWLTASARLDNEPLLATPDAYRWLAGAAGQGPGAGEVPALLLKLASFLDISPAWAAFLLPVFLAAFLAPVVAVWAARLGRPAAGLTAGILAGLAPGYYLRTRLGFYDMDMFVLPLATLLALGLAYALDWGGATQPAAQPGRQPGTHGDTGVSWPGWFGLGGLACLARFADPDGLGALLAGLFVWAALLVLVLERGPARTRRVWGLALAVLTALHGWPGLAGGAVLTLAMSVLARRSGRVRFLDAAGASLLCALAGLTLALLLGGAGAKIWAAAGAKLGSWLGTSGQMAADRLWFGADYFPVTPSVAENVRPPWLEVLRRAGPNPLLSGLGLAGFLWLGWRRRAALLLAPLLGLGLASAWLGARFSQFAAPALALGLALPAGEMFRVGARHLRSRVRPAVAEWGGAVVLTLLAGGPLLSFYAGLPPEPVLTPVEARTLRMLGQTAPFGSSLWVWWDQGYAASYFSGLPVPADGGRNDPRRLFRLASVLGGDDPGRAATVIRQIQAGPAYVFVSWSMLGNLAWMRHFAHPSFLGDTPPPQVVALDAPFLLDADSGTLRVAPESRPGGRKLGLSGFAVLGREGAVSREYPARPGAVWRVLLDRDSGRAWLLDGPAAGCLAARFLSAGAGEREALRPFRLCIEAAPFCRVYVLDRD